MRGDFLRGREARQEGLEPYPAHESSRISTLLVSRTPAARITRGRLPVPGLEARLLVFLPPIFRAAASGGSGETLSHGGRAWRCRPLAAHSPEVLPLCGVGACQ